MGPFAAASFSSLSHTAWALSLAWIVVACSSGYGGYVNKLLSAPIIYPFSRVTYCAYLVHPISIRFISLGSDATIHLGNDSMVCVHIFPKFPLKIHWKFHQIIVYYKLWNFVQKYFSDGPLLWSLGIIIHFGLCHFIVVWSACGHNAKNTHNTIKPKLVHVNLSSESYPPHPCLNT